MQPVAGADDLIALLDVLDKLSVETAEHRNEIDTLCATADSLYEAEEDIDTAELERRVAIEQQRHLGTMALLDSALGYLADATRMLRQFSRAEVVRTLDLYHQCSQELYQWQSKRRQAEYELLELKRTEVDVAAKLAATAQAIEDRAPEGKS